MNIKPLNTSIQKELQDKIDFKTKPIGSLGLLEKISLKIGTIQNTLNPTLINPSILVFAADHGIVAHKPVSLYPQEVTKQMVLNFLNGGAAINVFCKQNNIHLKIVDAGVNFNFKGINNLIDAKIAMGTKDYSKEPAMTKEQFDAAFEKGREIVQQLHFNKTNIIGFGEMGIGNTSSASLLMSAFTKISIEKCIGKGAGLNNEGVLQKIEILTQVQNLHKENCKTPIDILRIYGGFEIVMICAAIMEAASLKMTILIDGFIVTTALLAAYALNKNVLEYCIFSHTSEEKGHQDLLSFLKATPLLNLGMRLGEGSGCAVAFPIIKSAVLFLNEMATFKSANVSKA